MIRGIASTAGADAVVINTCAVTGEAVKQARQTIRRLRREQPHKKIVVTGCAAQTDPEIFAAMPEVDRVLGNEEKLSAASWAAFDSAGKISVGDIMAVTDDRAASDRPHRGPHPRVSSGAERLRPSLHVLHHSVRPRQFALGAGRRCGGAGAAAGGVRPQRDRADRRRHHELRAGARRAGEANSARRARAQAAAAVVDRLRSRPTPICSTRSAATRG